MAIFVYINPFAHQSSGGGGGGGGGGGSLNQYNMTDCEDGSSFVGQTSSTLTVGDVVHYGTAPPYSCASVASTASSGATVTLGTSYSDCCDCNSTNICRGTSGFATPTSTGSYNSSGYAQTVTAQITPAPGSPSAYVINSVTQVSVETKLGGRAASTVLLSAFGTVTSTYPSGASSSTIQHAYDGSSCFNSASETLEWRLKVECGAWNGSAIASCSTAYTAWQSTTLNHSSSSQQCSGGTLYEFTDCFDSSTHLVEDQSGYSLSVGDFVDVYDSSSNQRCGTITATNQSGSANGAYINGDGYSSCSDCVSSTGISNPTLYTATDCNNSSATYILADDQYNNFPATGDVHLAYLSSSSIYVCVTITGTTSSGTSVGYLDSSETDCATCSSNNGLTLYTVQECGSDTLEVIEDAAYLSLSTGDVVSYYRNSAGTTHCGTITGTTTNGPAAGETSAGYEDCAECISYEGL